MDIRIKGIGLIDDSTVRLDGLTVITGANNSGKSTCGKILYSVLKATSHLSDKAQRDQRLVLYDQYLEAHKKLDVFIMMRLGGAQSTKPTAFDMSMELSSWGQQLILDIQQKASRVIEIANRGDSHDGLFLHTNATAVNEDFAAFATAAIHNDIDIHRYVDEELTRMLVAEFKDDIQNSTTLDQDALIELSDQGNLYTPFIIHDDIVAHNREETFYVSPLDEVFFIDDAYILDHVYRHDSEPHNELERRNSRDHRSQMLDVLSSIISNPSYLSPHEKLTLDDSLTLLYRKIDKIVPGSLYFDQGNLRYKDSSLSLNASNLATGSKMFSIIKVLLKAGKIGASTQLILDEPEAHLHPEWQNKFAEIIVLLVKELHISVLLTTHSPNFALALEAYMRKHRIKEKCHFYLTQDLPNGLKKLELANDNLGMIYDDFITYFSEMSLLRDMNSDDDE